MVGLLDQFFLNGMRPPNGPFDLQPGMAQIPAGLLSGMPFSPEGSGPFVMDQSGTPLQPPTGAWREDGGVPMPPAPPPPPNDPVSPNGPNVGDFARMGGDVVDKMFPPGGLLGGPTPAPASPAPNLPAFARGGYAPPMPTNDLSAPNATPVSKEPSAAPKPPTAPGAAAGAPLQLPGARPPVPVGGQDMPGMQQNPARPAAPATAPGKEADKPGFFDVLGSIYGKGGPGDSLIALGAGLMSGPNAGAGLMKGMAMVNANALTAKKADDERRKSAGMLTLAEAMSKRNGQPIEVNLGILQSGMGGPIVQDTLSRDKPQLVKGKDPITGEERDMWVAPGQSTGTPIGGAAPQPGAQGGQNGQGGASPGSQNTDAQGQPLGLYTDQQGRRMYRTVDGRNIPVIGNIPESVKSLTEADQRAVAEAPAAYRNLASLRKNIDELVGNKDANIPAHAGLAGWGGLTSRTGAAGEYLSQDTKDARSRLEQIKGQAFLQAFQQLKGAGAVTEAEGAKASQAIARLNDPRVGEEAFNKAMADLREATETAMQRLSRIPGVDVGQPAQGNLPPGVTIRRIN